MWLKIVYFVLVSIGFVCYAYSLYVEVRNEKLRKEGKEVRKESNITSILGAIFVGLLAGPVIELTEKLLSPYITSEIAMFFFQILVVVVLLLAIGIPVRCIAKR